LSAETTKIDKFTPVNNEGRSILLFYSLPLKFKSAEMTLIRRFIFLLLTLFSLLACHRNPLKVDISNINLTMKIGRLDQDLFAVTQSNIQLVVPALQEKYDPFFTLYNKEILAIGNSSDSLYAEYLLTFLADSMVSKAKQKTDSLFHDFQPYAKELELAFRHYRYYFPKNSIPAVYTYLSGFNQSVVTMPEALGISLDNYLGSNCKFYVQLGIPAYKRQNMDPKKLVYDALYGFVSQQFEYRGNAENLISNMIHQGKLLYLLDALIPDGPDSLKIGFRSAQLDWCKANEKEMWSYLVEKKMLFSGDRMELVRFINSAPFTTPFGQKSPGRTGVWIGWQIVKSYMKNNPETKLQDMMKENDYHKILNESGYSPE
jgi:gliding motility-associated lipoprotein GldB